MEKFFLFNNIYFNSSEANTMFVIKTNVDLVDLRAKNFTAFVQFVVDHLGSLMVDSQCLDEPDAFKVGDVLGYIPDNNVEEIVNKHLEAENLKNDDYTQSRTLIQFGDFAGSGFYDFKEIPKADAEILFKYLSEYKQAEIILN